MRFDVAVHFVVANNTYQGQLIVRRAVPNPGEIAAVTLTLPWTHETAAAAIEEATGLADSIRAEPEQFRPVFDQLFRRVRVPGG
jgi:hypothetical protein